MIITRPQKKIRQRGYGRVLLTVMMVTHSRQRSVRFAKRVPARHSSSCRRRRLEARRGLLTPRRSFLPPSLGLFRAWRFGRRVWKAGQNQHPQHCVSVALAGFGGQAASEGFLFIVRIHNLSHTCSCSLPFAASSKFTPRSIFPPFAAPDLFTSSTNVSPLERRHTATSSAATPAALPLQRAEGCQ